MLRNFSTNTQSLPEKQPMAGHRSAQVRSQWGCVITHRALSLAILLSCLVGTLLLAKQQPAFAESNALPVAQAGQGKLAVVGAQGTELYDAPGGTAGASLTPGTTLTAIGRTADSLWIAVVTDDESNGWVETSTIVIFGAEQLPVQSDLPTAAPTSAATAVDEEMAEGTATAVEEMAPTSTSVAATATAVPTMTATPLPSPTPTAVPPTATPTAVPPTATPLPTATALLPFSASSELIAVVGSNGANLAPDQSGSGGSALPVGTALTAIGRSADSTMLYVTTTEGDEGWVVRSAVVAFNTEALPVRGEEGMTPADDATPAAEAVMGEAGATATGEETMVEEATAEETTATATFVPTAPPTMTETPLPTATPTQAMRPTPEADGRPTAQVAMTGSRLNIRSGPGTQFPIIGKALPREIFIANGRNGDNTWVQLAVPDLSGGFGWVTSNLVTLSEPIAELPIMLETNDTAAPQSSTIAAQLASNPTPVASSGVTPAAAPTTSSATTASAAQPAGLSGKMVIQTQWGGTFYLYNLASGALGPVSSGLDPALSPDGSQIAFTRIGGNAGGVYLINSDGSNERQIFKASEQLMAPKWSPDGKWVVFSRSNGSYTCNDIAFVGCLSDGQLFPEPPGGLPPALEEARKDVLDGFDRVSRPNWQLSRVNLDGKEYRDLAALDSARAPDWIEAGIVYQSGGGLQITQDKPDGETRQVYHDGWDWDPDWQPGGGRIVFQSKEGPHWEIFAVNPDGNGLTALTRPVTTLVDELPSNVSPAWSPDGQYVAYLSNRTDSNEAGPWRVWVMGADGSNQHPLPIDLPINYGFAGEQMVSWSK